MMKDVFPLLLVICVVGLLGGEKGRVVGEIEPCNSTFSCLLRNFSISVSEYQTKTHGFQVKISDLFCTGFSLGRIDSSTDLIAVGTEDTDDPSWTLGVNVTDIGLVCDVHFYYKRIGFPFPKGSGDVSIALYGTHLGLDVSIVDTETGKEGDLSFCEFVLDVENAELTADPFTRRVLKGMEETILVSVEGAINSELCDKVLANLVNNDLTNALGLTEKFNLPPPPPLPPLDIPEGVVNFTDSRILDLLGKLTGKYGTEIVNFIANRFTNNGTISLGNGNLVDFSFDLPITLPFGDKNKTFILRGGLENVQVGGLNSFENVTLLEPVGETELETVLELEELNLQLKILLEILLVEENGKTNETVLFESESIFTFGSEGDKIEIIGQALVEKDEIVRLINYPLSIGSLPCDSLLVSNLTLLSLSLSSEGGGVDAEVVGKDNSGLGELLDNVLLLLMRSLGAEGAKAVENLVGGMGRDIIDEIIFGGLEAIHDEAGECTPSFPQKSDHWRYQAKVFSFLTALLLSVFVMGLLSYKYIKRKIHEKMTEQSPLVNPFEPTRDPPLGLHPEIPWFVRTGVPTLLFLLIASFISSNTGTGASVLGDVDFQTLSNNTVSIVHDAPLFRFSLWNSVHDMWQAGVYPLSILIFVFSGLWPYTKLFLMLFCWLAPTSVLSSKRRESLLIMLDALGKWSLIDTYVLVLMLVAFRFYIVQGFLTINLVVEPKPGFYLFLVATIGSLLMTHLIVAIHRHVRFPRAVREFESDFVNPLYALAFPLGGKLVRCTIVGVVAVPVLLFIAFCFVIWGSVVDSFEFTFGGLAGWALGDEASSASYSLIGVGQAIQESVIDPGAGTSFIQACFFIFALAVPLSHLLCLMMLWLIPMSGTAQRRTFVLAEVLNAWSALEVFVVSIIAALLEISQFAAFIVGDDCDPIDKLLHLPPLNKLVDGDDTCFDVTASLSSGCWILFAACLIYVACRMLVMHVCHESLEYRYAKGKKHLLAQKQAKHLQSLDDDEDDDLIVVEEDAGIMCKLFVALRLVNYTIE